MSRTKHCLVPRPARRPRCSTGCAMRPRGAAPTTDGRLALAQLLLVALPLGRGCVDLPRELVWLLGLRGAEHRVVLRQQAKAALLARDDPEVRALGLGVV